MFSRIYRYNVMYCVSAAYSILYYFFLLNRADNYYNTAVNVFTEELIRGSHCHMCLYNVHHHNH